MRLPRTRLHRSSLALLIAAAAPTALQAQDPPHRAAHEAAHVVQQSPAGRAAHAQTVLSELVQRPAPRGLSERERQQWNAQTEWLRSVERRMAELVERAPDPDAERAAAASSHTIRREVDKATPQIAETVSGDEDGTADGEETVALRLAQLQQAVQQESRRFQTSSNAMKARHDMAMNTIRNLK